MSWKIDSKSFYWVLGVKFYLPNRFKILLACKMEKCEGSNIEVGICIWPWCWEEIVESCCRIMLCDAIKKNEPMTKLESKVDY